MKRLTCEMCGSTDLMKQEGVFVCQTCGCKYSVEEARKMMIEGTVDVQGTVKMDRSSELEKILRNADMTFEDGNFMEAFDLYSQALSIEPDNPRAIMFRAISSAWQSSVKDCKITEINKAAGRAYKLQHEMYGDSKEYFDFCYTTSLKVAPLLNAIANMYVNYYNKANPKTISITGAIATADISMEVKNTLELGTKNCCIVCSNMITYITDDVKDFTDSSDGLWTVLNNMAKNCVVYRSNANMSADPALAEQVKKVEAMAEQAKKDIELRRETARNAYWAEHPEEKAQLDSEITSLETQIDSIKNQIDLIPEKNEIASLEDKIVGLKKQRESLGLLKGKEKKALQEQINQFERELSALKKRKEETEESFLAQIKPLETRINEITLELIKDR